MSPSAEIRSQARQTLKGNYVAAVAAFMILLIPVYIIMGLTFIVQAFLAQGVTDKKLFDNLMIIICSPLSIMVTVLLSPLFNGFIRIFYQATLTKDFKISNLFYYFTKGRYHRALLLNLSLVVRLFIPAVLCYLPLIVYYYLCFEYFPSFYKTVLFTDFSFILTVMSSILLILYSMKYFVVLTLFSSDDDTDPRELFRMSKTIMSNQKSDATRLIFSFTPWLLLCLLIVPALYVVPYMTQSLCIGAKWMTLKGK